jgi:hypothetical protein
MNSFGMIHLISMEKIINGQIIRKNKQLILSIIQSISGKGLKYIVMIPPQFIWRLIKTV